MDVYCFVKVCIVIKQFLKVFQFIEGKNTKLKVGITWIIQSYEKIKDPQGFLELTWKTQYMS